ncbi:stage II sporulation protein M [Clostridium ganghwense]|uniref:Stage II sporulation protein M n=1 Tax=Clostridium ganghwense TaxID=312089 RepID=A0ABT4CPY7_9CLOT|nr:stage II sporulation protein M [Clostridium ganghwense]MCY6370301.1 stage II sporulation protein M [Clostridium ganghwense]
MKNRKTFGILVTHIQRNLFLYVISLLFLCIGIVLGVYTVKYMGEVEKDSLISYFLNFTQNIDLSSVDKKHIFLQAIKNNIPIIIGIWFLGLSMLGIPIILFIDLIKGFTIGFTTSFVINGLGTKGILINILTIFPQNVIYIPCIIIASATAMEFSLMLLKYNGFKNINKNNNLIKVLPYSTIFLFIFGFMILGFLLESYITPSMLKLIVSSTGCAFG